MAYNKSQRYPPAPEYFRFYDPGAYQYTYPPLIKPNKVGFLSKAPRTIKSGGVIWTHAIYDTELPKSIPNCTSLQSKIPRFPYKALSEEDIKELLCRCGLNDPCECPIDDEVDQSKRTVICQGKVRRRIFKGISPKIQSENQIIKKDSGGGPSFYDVRVNESTAFYHGWKWSQWTSTRSQKVLEDKPGPADYTLEKEPDIIAICAEKVREHKRKTCKKLRYIEMVQHQNIINKRPGPATYTPMLPKGPEIQFIGSKAERFPVSLYNISPGPADHWLKRDFDPAEIPERWCQARLPSHAPFGVKAARFKPRREEGASPAKFNIVYKPCQFMRCSTAPFGSSAVRFKDTQESDNEEEFDTGTENKEFKPRECPAPTWQFKSKTIRIKPLKKKPFEQSPADLPQGRYKINKSIRLQYNAPFCSSVERFMPWFNDMPVFANVKTPGPAYYCLEKYKCQPAVLHGPLYRSRRFVPIKQRAPPPNSYEVSGGIETILETHNKKLRDNIENQHKFHWEPPVEPLQLSLQEQESKLLDESIALLDTVDVFDTKPSKSGSVKSSSHYTPKQKLLRCFLYRQQIERSC